MLMVVDPECHLIEMFMSNELVSVEFFFLLVLFYLWLIRVLRTNMVNLRDIEREQEI